MGCSDNSTEIWRCPRALMQVEHMSVASRHESGTTELVVPTAAAAEANCPSGRSSRPEQVSSRMLPPAPSMFETHTWSVHSSMAALAIPVSWC